MTSAALAIQHRRAAPAGARYELILQCLHECLAALATRANARLVHDLVADLPWDQVPQASPALRVALYRAVRQALDVLKVWTEFPPFPAEPSAELSRRYVFALDRFNEAHRTALALAQRELRGVG